MDTKELKRTAPERCAKHDRFMEAAGRPDMKIGAEGWTAFLADREQTGEARPEMLAWTAWRVTEDAKDPAIVKRGNKLQAEIYACDRIGIYH